MKAHYVQFHLNAQIALFVSLHRRGYFCVFLTTSTSARPVSVTSHRWKIVAPTRKLL